MKRRYFWSILLVLVSIVVSTLALHKYLVKQDRLQLIDQQIRETASVLLASEINGLEKINFQQIEDILSEELGEIRIGKFFILRNAQGETLYESNAATLLPVSDVPRNSQWVTLTGKGQYIRALNLKLPQVPDRTLQVGVVIDEDLLAPRFISQHSFIFALMIFSIGLGMSWILTSYLLFPITLLSKFVSQIVSDDKRKLELPDLPEQLKTVVKKDKDLRDEMNILISSFEALIARVNKGYRLSRFWSYQMAHELKTPLAVMESLLQKENSAEEVRKEIFRASEIITSFLSWAESENINNKNLLHACKMSSLISSICANLERQFPQRIILQTKDDFSVITNRQQLTQVLVNLIQNSCKYTEGSVTVTLKEHRVEVTDEGDGLPPLVVERMGEPFNKGPISEGSGLGLAYVYSVCRQFDWELHHRSLTPKGTQWTLVFPTLADQDLIDNGQDATKTK